MQGKLDLYHLTPVFKAYINDFDNNSYSTNMDMSHNPTNRKKLASGSLS